MAVGDIGAIIESRNILGFGYFTGFYKGAAPNLYIHSQGQDARVRSFTIDDDGTNISAGIGHVNFELAVLNTGGNVIHIAGDVYAFIWRGNVNNFIGTFSCDANGNMAGPIATFNLGTVAAGLTTYPHLAHVYGNIYVASWTDNANDGWMSTVQINNDGTIGGAAIATWEWQADLGERPYILNCEFRHGGNLVFANVAAERTGIEDGCIRQIEITNAGAFAGPGWNSLFNPFNNQQRQQIFPLGNNLFVIFSAHANTGWMRTCSIYGNGAPTAIDDWEWEPTFAQYPTAIDIGLNDNGTARVFCVTKYGAALEPNHLKTIAVNLDGTIQKALIDSLQIDTEPTCMVGDIVRVSRGIYAVVYYNPVTGRTWVATVDIEEAAAVPAATTDPATSVAANTATLNGTLDDDGGEACDCGFEWGESEAYGNTTPTQSRTTGQTFAQPITGLDPNKTYHFRAFATNSAGTSYGADRTFITLAVALSVTTDPATGLGPVTATLNGTLDADGGEVCQCGFEWGLDTGYGALTPTESKTAGQTFSQVIGGLAPNTTYHFRAFATNSTGTGYGADRTFTTKLVISKAYALAREEL